jgi:hypothetical protein
MDNSQIREETSINDSSLHNHRVLFKKQKSHSIVYGDPHQDHVINRTKNISLSGKTFGLHKADSKSISSNEQEKRVVIQEKVPSSTENNTTSNINRKNESLNKSLLTKKPNGNEKKFFLNTSFKMFHFKGGSKNQESASKHSPSFSNSNLPTDIPSNKV